MNATYNHTGTLNIPIYFYIDFYIPVYLYLDVYTCAAGRRTEMSSNVISEDLHNTHHLATTYYVTDTTQASDFYWDRESGLRVNIGILDVHLIPEYEDVEHDSDNKYMTSNPSNNEDKEQYERVLKDFCRYSTVYIDGLC